MGFFSVKCTSKARLDGKTAIVTGSNTGIGKCTVQDFYRRGARVIMACRNTEKAQKAATEIKKACGNEENLGNIDIIELDLTSLESVRKCAKQLLENEKCINLLINNAGIMFCPYSKTEDGFEMHIGTNHLGHFLFTLLLLPRIIKSAPSRIVNVSSYIHILVRTFNVEDLNWEKRSYSSIQAYSHSKLANILFTKELTRKLQDANVKGVTTYTLHPGTISTDLGRHVDASFFGGAHWIYKHILKYFFKTPEQGAQTTIHCAVDEGASNETGLHYEECKSTTPSSNAQNTENAKKLWDVSIKMVELDENYNPFLIK